jgi:hypothetical protein
LLREHRLEAGGHVRDFRLALVNQKKKSE